jgi:hypothetical protein
MSDQLEVITVNDYVADQSLRAVADAFMAEYGYEPKEVGEIRFTDRSVSFCVRLQDGDPFVWIDHERTSIADE